jgi:hypothetical protein
MRDEGNPVRGALIGMICSTPLWLLIGAGIYWLEWRW